MIVVKVELWPAGKEQHAREIARGHITNDGTGSILFGNYDVRLLKSAEYSKTPGKTYKRGYVRGFKRRRGPWPLLLAALNSALEVAE